MQIQKKQKASILIWVFFLTIILSISFIYISLGINKSLKNNNLKNEFLEQEKQKEEFLGDINSKTKKIGENNLIVRDFSSLEYALKKDETLELKFDETGNISLELLNPGIISYAVGSEELGENVLPTYNTGITQTSFPINASNKTLKIKNFSGYSKIRIGASKSISYNFSVLPKTITFKKATEINLSVGRKGGEIKYYINDQEIGNLAGNSSVNYVQKNFLINSGDKLKVEKVSGDDYKKVTISWPINLSDMLKNNSYKIIKKSWGREIVVEKGKIK